MADIDGSFGENLKLEWHFELTHLIHALCQLPVPLYILYHTHKQYRRARNMIQLEHDAPVLLPIYFYIIYAQILTVAAKFVLYGFLYSKFDFGDRSGDRIVADTWFHAFVFMSLADGMAVFMLVLIFSFLISPTAGRNSLHTSLRRALLQGGFYITLGVFCMSALSREYLKAYYILQVVAPCTVLAFLISSLLYMYKQKSSRWKWWLFASVWLTTILWGLYVIGCIAKLSGVPPIYITSLRYFISFVYSFILPYVFYQALIQDSIYWRNLDKYLFPTDSKRHRLLDYDILGSLCLSQEKGHLDDTLSSFKVPLVDFMHLESATGLLGKGGYAIVWKAMYHGAPVAVKELLQEKLSIKHIKSFFREAVLTTRLDHPNVLKFYGACVQPPQFLMIFEWCNRGDLGSYLVKEAAFLNARVRLDMAVQACNALNILHQKGLIHRDIKPANYLVHVDGHRTIVKLGDFGSCRSMHDKLPLFEGVSPLFVAPEIRELIPHFFDENGQPIRDKARPNINYSHEVDVFGLGWVLWAIFKQDPYKKVLKARSSDIFSGLWMPSLDDIYEYVADVIADCWEQQPSNRPSSEVVYETLFAVQRKHFESFNGENTLSSSKSSDNIGRSFFSGDNILQMASSDFRDGVKSFIRNVKNLQAVLGKEPNVTAKEVLKCAEHLNMMALNGTVSTDVDQLINVLQECTKFPYSTCRTIMRFRQALENDIEDFTITGITSAFSRNTKYDPSRIIRRKCQVFQFEPTSKNRESGSYNLSSFTQRERLVYEHNKRMFAPMALEFDKAILWKSDINLHFPGISSIEKQSSKSVFPMYNFDGKGDMFVMLFIMFPYFDSIHHKYGSFSLQGRIDFHPKLRKNRPEYELLRIYDTFIQNNFLLNDEQDHVIINCKPSYV